MKSVGIQSNARSNLRKSSRRSSIASASTSKRTCPARKTGPSRWWTPVPSLSASCFKMPFALQCFPNSCRFVSIRDFNRSVVSPLLSHLPPFAALRSFFVVWFFAAQVYAEPQANWSFRNDVQPILAKSGCSSGACHGAAAGQNGFKLSLRGYDDEGDYLTLTRAAFGRRINPSDPARSLMLLKPAGAVPHKGGKRFDVDSPDYRILSEWIASGAPGPKNDDPRIVRIEILPPHSNLKPGETQQLRVNAHFTDGRVQDVTRWAKYSSA